MIGHWVDIFKPIPGMRGQKWHFKYWYSSRPVSQVIFFWDEEQEKTGYVELPNGGLTFRKVKQLMLKIAKDSDYRKKFLRPLKFPLERHYP